MIARSFRLLSLRGLAMLLPDVRQGYVHNLLIILATILLSACADKVSEPAAHRDADIVPPREQVTDYRMVSCERLWTFHHPDAMNNALYWLRYMECADLLTAAQAREQTLLVGDNNWSGLWRQAILLDHAELTVPERHQIMDQLNRHVREVPVALLPLLQIWMDKQNLTITLEDERLRFQRIQETNDKQLESMREQQGHLQYQLETTTRKLESLTDIERQLSNRKSVQSDLSENEERRAGTRSTSDSSTKQTDAVTPPAVVKKGFKSE
ncbi:two-component system QseEF-associated lipoprotein QseG [Musicola keenii]|uniref:two-component system QseEF-associated lipoprotein QseG n=1 Tax=Musicola keenii TaxID=2884250 RepID=UPI00177CB968|nr:two-component system QseEF-associated lipoprotein QseG [Musicola keenii]